MDASHISLTHAYAASGAYTASAVVKDTNGKYLRNHFRSFIKFISIIITTNKKSTATAPT